jgi:beta-xylosidase
MRRLSSHNLFYPLNMFSDTDIFVENRVYYLLSDTVWFSPGLIILKSVDLINWDSYTTVIPNITATCR